ncbi:hypothetical protein [Streptomyces sp. NRRL S-646]|uniref:hypothetical protein n=1 Tax=Streptomyces sp. NRRL S-646 TaxID=1463917 RepID=UPI000ACE73D1|nr:hypothetical protein [Streptomyces sp. NRRL S-646]
MSRTTVVIRSAFSGLGEHPRARAIKAGRASRVDSRIGLIATVSSTFHHPGPSDAPPK